MVGGKCVLGNSATNKYGVVTRLRAGVSPSSHFNLPCYNNIEFELGSTQNLTLAVQLNPTLIF